ncbi:tetratricopeptide repeat-containing sensor histidine kinase [Rufibacter sp. XAAS-G3-1]|uniref:tetratricopeptide repeat-containing sensor histidine kinase n=1 Tax=Rufibacter sp. XAAS-G3-1 TaxID=2729134 RepID=UPI0015E69F67|nr:tetratricopeptide repeat-containing sensor histidine kinase [Rufibacter sp. XAAS-G3-1]
MEQLLRQAESAPQDTSQVSLLCDLSRQYMLTDVKTGMQHAKEAHVLAKRLRFSKGEAQAIGLIGSGHLVLGEYDKALPYYYTALKIAEQLKDTALLVATYNSLGILCYKTKDDRRAFQNYELAQAFALKTNNRVALGKVYNNIGNIHEDNGDYAKALGFYEKAAAIQRETGVKKSYAIGLLNIGNVYTLMNKPQEALPYLFQALQIDEELHNNMNMTVTLHGIAKSYLALRQTETALDYAKRSYEVAKKTESGKKIIAAAQLLAEIYASRKEYEKAYTYQQIFARQSAKLGIERQNRTAAEIIAKFESDKRELENLKLKAQRRIQAIEIEQQKAAMWFAGVILFLLSILVVILYFSRRHFKVMSRQLQEATDLLLQNNQKITAQKEEISKQSSVLERKNHQLDRHNSFKSKIFSIVTHDLRTPFSSIQGILQLVQNRTFTEDEVKRIFESLGKNMEVVVSMMDNLLGWSKAQMQGSSLELQSFQLYDFVEQNLQVMSEQASAKGVYLVNRIDRQVRIFSDKERLAFVLRNLLGNAIKFSFEGGEVTLEMREEEAGVSLMVSDTGKGISEKHQAKLFSDNRFTTLGTSKEKGTGLGLMLCKELMESLGGDITVQSVENQGSSFTIFLPCHVQKMEQEQAPFRGRVVEALEV